MPVSIESVYGKLRRVLISLTLGPPTSGSAGLWDLFPETVVVWDVPISLADFHPIIFDGKTIKEVTKRLKATREAPGKLSSGKLLVALSARTGMVPTMAADPDGEANEATRVPRLDSPNHCGHPRQPPLHCRPPARLPGPDRPRHRAGGGSCDRPLGQDDHPYGPQPAAGAGRGYHKPRSDPFLRHAGAASNKHRRYRSRVTSLSSDEESVALLADLLDEHRYPANRLLEAYLLRWGIESDRRSLKTRMKMDVPRTESPELVLKEERHLYDPDGIEADLPRLMELVGRKRLDDRSAGMTLVR